MSIAAATRQAFAVEAEEKSPEFREAAATPRVESALEEVTQWIPSEAVALYVAMVGIFSLDSTGGKWIVFAIGAISVLAFVLLNAALVNKRGAAAWAAEGKSGAPPKLTGKRLLWLVAIAGVAYFAWAFALPATPFLELTDEATRIGGVLVIGVSLGMPKLAELLDLRTPQA